MPKHKIKKAISIILSIALTGTMIPCGAANLVPFNAVNPVVPPSAPVTRPVVESNSSSDGFSIQSIQSKVSDIINPQNGKPKLKETYSGTRGDNVSWNLDTETGVLTISGAGEMADHSGPWYDYRSFIKSVVINNGVTSIGEDAFSWCSELASVKIGNSVITIGESAFFNCQKLTSVTIGNSVTTIGEKAFKDCRALTSVAIPDSVTSIGEDAFSGCSNSAFTEYDNALYLGNDANPHYALIKDTDQTITSCEIHEKTKVIADAAFQYSWLDSVTIPDSVIYIGDVAFHNIHGLKSVTIPDSVISIGKQAFGACSKLESVTIGNSVTSIGYSAFSDSIITSITIPDSVTSIGEDAFRCSSLSFNEYDNAKYLGNDANPYYALIKAKDNSITSCQINEKTKVIAGRAFERCSSLTSVTIPTSVITIGEGAFLGCNCWDLKSVTIPNSVTSIEGYAFYECSALQTVTIPSSVTSIGNCAFDRCYGLKLVSFDGTQEPANVGSNVFESCDSLNAINVPATYEGDTFCSKPVKKEGKISGTCGDNVSWELDQDTGVFTISGTGAMDDFINDGLMLLDIRQLSSNTAPWNDYKNSIKSVIIESGVTSIGSYAFSNCNALTSATIPASITSIGDHAFYSCSTLSTINFNGSHAPAIGNEAFTSCGNLNTINVPSTYEGNEFGGVVVKKSADSVDPVNPEDPADPVDPATPEDSADPVDPLNPSDENVQGNSSITSKSSKLSGGAIAGIVVGSVAAVSAIVGAVGTILYLKHKHVKVHPEEVPA